MIELVKEPRGIWLVIELVKEIPKQQLDTKLSLLRNLLKSMPMLVVTIECVIVTREVSIIIEGFQIEKELGFNR